MASLIGQCLRKIGKHNVSSFCQLSQNLFKNQISNEITLINKSIPTWRIDMPSSSASYLSINDIPLNKFTIRERTFRNTFRRILGFCGVPGYQLLAIPCTSRFEERVGHSLQQKFTNAIVSALACDNFFWSRMYRNEAVINLSNRNLSRNFTPKYDFPIYPIPTQSKKLQPKREVRPIAQNYMPLLPLSHTKSSEKLYRHMGHKRKPILADVPYSFPCSLRFTQSDVRQHVNKPKELLVPEAEKTEEKNLNAIIDKLSSSSRSSFWSSGDNFSFPSIRRSRNVATFGAQVDEEIDQNLSKSSTDEIINV